MQQTPTPDNNNKNNIIVGPDYGQMMKLSTNGAIIEAFITQLFNKDTKFDMSMIFTMIRNMAILLIVKTTLEDSKTYLDTFKFTNLAVFRHMYQSFCYSTQTYNFVLVGGKWKYDEMFISTSTLTPFLEQKSIFLNQPSTYYYEWRSYLIKVIVCPQKISFTVPNIDCVKGYVESEIIRKNQEVVFGGKTTMSRIIVTSSNTVKIESIQLAYAFETENYRHLKESISQSFLVEDAMEFSKLPFCVNFDGPPGTGKTTFGSYIASCGLFDRIMVCNMVQASQLNFQDLIVNIDRQLTTTAPKEKKTPTDAESVLLILDEIDKWLESYITNQIQKRREEASTKKQIQDGKSPATIIEGVEKMTVAEEDEKKMHLKTEFLDQLYRLIEGTLLSETRRHVIIFNTNHFDRLFENVDKRFEAYRDRFSKYKFEQINKQEIISYFTHYKSKLQSYNPCDINPEKKVLAERGVRMLCSYDDSVYNSIPENILITYRQLYKILRYNRFNVEITIKFMSEGSDTDFFPTTLTTNTTNTTTTSTASTTSTNNTTSTTSTSTDKDQV